MSFSWIEGSSGSGQPIQQIVGQNGARPISFIPVYIAGNTIQALQVIPNPITPPPTPNTVVSQVSQATIFQPQNQHLQPINVIKTDKRFGQQQPNQQQQQVVVSGGSQRNGCDVIHLVQRSESNSGHLDPRITNPNVKEFRAQLVPRDSGHPPTVTYVSKPPAVLVNAKLVQAVHNNNTKVVFAGKVPQLSETAAKSIKKSNTKSLNILKSTKRKRKSSETQKKPRSDVGKKRAKQDQIIEFELFADFLDEIGLDSILKVRPTQTNGHNTKEDPTSEAKSCYEKEKLLHLREYDNVILEQVSSTLQRAGKRNFLICGGHGEEDTRSITRNMETATIDRTSNLSQITLDWNCDAMPFDFKDYLHEDYLIYPLKQDLDIYDEFHYYQRI
eukprot:TRINITY_DN3117_c0_g1_i1.p1 TRINITY_DN3117_c0_g1~~TRINITY_DN3117_c0_g1_i1.p1  ORF type:complete len:387 (-),score=58.96 TRINITY_DN3117_c0_g1_i1:90-1250(-)